MMCDKHGKAPAIEICIHFCDVLVKKEVPKNFHVNEVYLRGVMLGKRVTGEFHICDNCLKMLGVEPGSIYDVDEFSVETLRIFVKIHTIYCCDCVDEWMGRPLRNL